MRLIFGVLSLLIVLAVVGMLAKTQLQSLRSSPGASSATAGASAAAAGKAQPAQRQIQHRIKDDVEKLMQPQPARGEPKE